MAPVRAVGFHDLVTAAGPSGHCCSLAVHRECGFVMCTMSVCCCLSMAVAHWLLRLHIEMCLHVFSGLWLCEEARYPRPPIARPTAGRRVDNLPCPSSESHAGELKRSGYGGLGRRGFATASQGNGVAVDSNRARPVARLIARPWHRFARLGFMTL